MLILNRKVNDQVVTNNGMTVTVVSIVGKQVRLGFDAPDDVTILRKELVGREEKKAEKQ